MRKKECAPAIVLFFDFSFGNAIAFNFGQRLRTPEDIGVEENSFNHFLIEKWETVFQNSVEDKGCVQGVS